MREPTRWMDAEDRRELERYDTTLSAMLDKSERNVRRLRAERDGLRRDVERLTGLIGADMAAENARLHAEIDRMRPVYEQAVDRYIETEDRVARLKEEAS